MRVLIADDDAVSRLYLEDALRDWGYEVACVGDGIAAHRLLLQDDPPPLAVLDWMMPGMDGLDICRAVRASNRESYTYLILLTSSSTAEKAGEAMRAGADDFIAKPFDPEQMERRLHAGGRIAGLERMLRNKIGH